MKLLFIRFFFNSFVLFSLTFKVEPSALALALTMDSGRVVALSFKNEEAKYVLALLQEFLRARQVEAYQVNGGDGGGGCFAEVDV